MTLLFATREGALPWLGSSHQLVGSALLVSLTASATLFGPEFRAASIAVGYDAPMKMIALERESERLGSQRYELRSRGQGSGIVCIATGLLGLGLAIASRKKPGFPPTGALIAGAVLTLAGFGVIQGIGDVF